MAIIFTESAGKHNLTEGDAIHAIMHHRWHVKDFTTPDYPDPADLYIGVSPAGQLVEVLVHPRMPRDLVIFHLMPLRKKTLQAALDDQ